MEINSAKDFENFLSHHPLLWTVFRNINTVSYVLKQRSPRITAIFDINRTITNSPFISIKLETYSGIVDKRFSLIGDSERMIKLIVEDYLDSYGYKYLISDYVPKFTTGKEFIEVPKGINSALEFWRWEQSNLP